MKEFKITVNGNEYNVAITSVENNQAEVEVNGTPYHVTIDKPLKQTPKAIKPVASVTPATASNPAATPPAPSVPVSKPATPVIGGAIKSPLPGVILEMHVRIGDQVKTGQKILVLEAMKMENSVTSDRDGKVVDIRVNKGDSVLEGADLVIIG
jgi:biotin carboxyl carrier protein